MRSKSIWISTRCLLRSLGIWRISMGILLGDRHVVEEGDPGLRIGLSL